MINQIIDLRKEDWISYEYGDVIIRYLKKSVFYNCKKELLFQEIVDNLSSLDALFENVNGTYSIVIETEVGCTIISDRLRTFPLYYYVKNKTFFLSDYADHFLSKSYRLSNDAMFEFACVGYISGNETLIEGVKQTVSSEILVFNKQLGLIESKRYFRFNYNKEKIKNITEAKIQLRAILDTAFQNLISFANGKQIVIPLSGGWDSRVVASMLRNLGYLNVICFTYGDKDDQEVKISKDVAKSLNFKWAFVEYNKNKWKEWDLQHIDDSFYLKLGGIYSIPCFQDGPALSELRKKNIIENDSIIVPGHSLDFLAGSHLPINFSSLTKFDGFNEILKKHFYFYPYFKLNRLRKILLKKNSFKSQELLDNIQFFEKWDFEERQCKYIVNSCRLYDYLGYSWAIPLWDKNLINLFLSVGIKHRTHQRFYHEAVIENVFTEESKVLNQIKLDNGVTPVEVIKSKTEPQGSKKSFKTIIIKFLYYFDVIEFFRKLTNKNQEPHFMGFHNWFSYNPKKQKLSDLKPEISKDVISQLGLQRFLKYKVSNLDSLSILCLQQLSIYYNRLTKNS